MKKITVSSDFLVYESTEELPDDVRELVIEAVKARERSYSPYSEFNVGSAIVLDNSEIITGSNQENASYPAGLCAERTALFYAGAKYPQVRMLKMVVSTGSDNFGTEKPVPLCGLCRQAIAEYEVKQGHPIEIYFTGESGNVVKASSVSDLLPLMFNKSYL